MADCDQILLKLIEKIAKEQKYVKYNVKLEPVSSGGANYTSKLYHVTVTETDRSDLNLFAKIAALSEEDRPPAISKIYDTERIAYTKLMNIYRTLEDRYKIPDEHKLSFPKYYDCNPTKYEEAIVIENLTATGFSLFSRLKSVDWKFAAKAVDELAKLHALSFAYEALYPEDFKYFLAVVKRDLVDNDQMTEHWKHVTSTAVNATKAENRDSLRRFLDRGKVEVLVKHLAPLKRAAITHGDYRVSNLMYRTCDNGEIEIKIVDLQTLQGGSPVVDLLYFIFTGSDEQFRAAHYERLVAHYYEQLARALRRLALDPATTYSRDDFHYELQEKLPFGLCIAVFALPVVTVAAEDAPTVDEELDIAAFSVERTSDLYAERINGVVNDYVKWGVLT